MRPFIIILCVLTKCLAIEFGPKYPATKGEVWPKPQFQETYNTFFVFRPNVFEIKITNGTCKILQNAVARYKLVFRKMYQLSRRDRVEGREWIQNPFRRHLNNYSGPLNQLNITLTMPCEDYPHFEMDESYELTVGSESTLQSNSVWGVLRGLETMAQLFYLSSAYGEVRINSTWIVDFPAYKHRGLLIDTGRHYLSVSTILLTIDAMEMNKMNVLHWHIVDDQSFPFESDLFPQLSAKGAFYPTLVYTRENVSNIIEYARNRGIRVIPEFDVPGHTRSWGEAVPNILTQCYKEDKVVGLGPLDPTDDLTYVFLQQFFAEVQHRFPDQYLHIGGDEVDVTCWQSNPVIQAYMEKYNISINNLQNVFMKAFIPLLNINTTPIVWQEVFDSYNYYEAKKPLDQNMENSRIVKRKQEAYSFLSKDTLVQVWKYGWVNEMINVLESGYKVLFSSSWYLDYLKFGWESFYTADPRQMVYVAQNRSDLLENIVGGEACIWGEMADDNNVLSRTWPRASAVAERLWSGFDYEKKIDKIISNKIRSRLEEHTCRMNYRGVRAQPPNGPGYCLPPLHTDPNLSSQHYS